MKNIYVAPVLPKLIGLCLLCWGMTAQPIFAQSLPLADAPPLLSDTAAAPSFLRLNTGEALPDPDSLPPPGAMPRELLPQPVAPQLSPAMGLSSGSNAQISTEMPVDRSARSLVAAPAPVVTNGAIPPRRAPQTAALKNSVAAPVAVRATPAMRPRPDLDPLASMIAAQQALDWLQQVDAGINAELPKQTMTPFAADGTVLSDRGQLLRVLQARRLDNNERRVLVGIEITPLAQRLNQAMISNVAASLSLKNTDWLVVLKTVRLTKDDSPASVAIQDGKAEETVILFLHQTQKTKMDNWQIAGFYQ